jgi:hypothetical protein
MEAAVTQQMSTGIELFLGIAGDDFGHDVV